MRTKAGSLTTMTCVGLAACAFISPTVTLIGYPPPPPVPDLPAETLTIMSAVENVGQFASDAVVSGVGDTDIKLLLGE